MIKAGGPFQKNREKNLLTFDRSIDQSIAQQSKVRYGAVAYFVVTFPEWASLNR